MKVPSDRGRATSESRYQNLLTRYLARSRGLPRIQLERNNVFDYEGLDVNQKPVRKGSFRMLCIFTKKGTKWVARSREEAIGSDRIAAQKVIDQDGLYFPQDEYYLLPMHRINFLIGQIEI